jgi:hypothetical protein
MSGRLVVDVSVASVVGGLAVEAGSRRGHEGPPGG